MPEIRIIAQNAMIESALALSKKYGVDLGGIIWHITDLLHRFTNAALSRYMTPDERTKLLSRIFDISEVEGTAE